MTVTIRDFQQPDGDAVNRIARAAFAQYENDYDGWDAFIEAIGRMADLAACGEIVVADDDGEIVGAVAYFRPGAGDHPIFPPEWSVIRMLVVTPGQRGRGIGRMLVAACIERAIRDQPPALGLHTSVIMSRALGLYTSLGFAKDSDLAPRNGVAYGRYALLPGQYQAALAAC